jgi:hypothetical protein
MKRRDGHKIHSFEKDKSKAIESSKGTIKIGVNPFGKNLSVKKLQNVIQLSDFFCIFAFSNNFEITKTKHLNNLS